jgi:hypothetical protein
MKWPDIPQELRQILRAKNMQFFFLLNDANLFRYTFLIRLFRIAANALFGSSEFMAGTAPSNTHRYKNLDAPPT